MKTARKDSLKFAEMPLEYTALCRLFLPRPIHDRTDYANILAVADVFAGYESKMTPGQNDYFDLLCTLIEAWERENVEPVEATPLDMLKHLLDEHKLSAADLSRILGASRMLGPMILRGERSITADHARTLGRYFHVSAGVFI